MKNDSCSSFVRRFSPNGAMMLLAVWFLGGLMTERVTASPPPPPEEIQKTLTAFFNLLKQDKIDDAYALILANTRIKGREDDVRGLKKQTRDAINTYGPILGFEIVEQRRVGLSLLQITCLSWAENFPLRWRFSYYRPGDKWRMLDIFVDDRVSELFETRAARVSQMDGQ